VQLYRFKSGLSRNFDKLIARALHESGLVDG